MSRRKNAAFSIPPETLPKAGSPLGRCQTDTNIPGERGCRFLQWWNQYSRWLNLRRFLILAGPNHKPCSLMRQGRIWVRRAGSQARHCFVACACAFRCTKRCVGFLYLLEKTVIIGIFHKSCCAYLTLRCVFFIIAGACLRTTSEEPTYGGRSSTEILLRDGEEATGSRPVGC